MNNSDRIYKSQIYWSVVYDHENNKLMLGQLPLASGLSYEKRLQYVKSFDSRAKAMNFEQVRFGFYTLADNSILADYSAEKLPF